MQTPNLERQYRFGINFKKSVALFFDKDLSFKTNSVPNLSIVVFPYSERYNSLVN